jgi:hypothetical protein
MEYNFQIQLNFEQLLTLVSQLPNLEKKRLLAAMIEDSTKSSIMQTKTIEEVLAKDYKYPTKHPQSLVGAWDTNESIETLLNLRTK